ncbi:hypothetical protein Tco_0099513 [Tanacetum coccineum]
MPTEMELTLEQTQQGISYEVSNIRVISFTMKMEILLEPTSNKLMVEHTELDESDTYVLERFDTSAGNPVNEILLKLNLPDHRSYEYPPSPKFVSEPVYSEFMPLEDDILPAKEQLLPTDVLPTTDSPGYVLESGPKEDPEEGDDEDPKEDPADYHADGRDDSDDKDESSDDDEDDDYQKYEMHHYLPDFVPEPVYPEFMPPEDESDPEDDRRRMMMMDSEEVPVDFLPIEESCCFTSCLIHLPPSAEEGRSRLRPISMQAAPPTTSTYGVTARYEVRESSSAPTARPTRGFRAYYGFVATMDREIMRDLERDVGYGITDTWEEMLVDMSGAPATDDTELGRRMTEFATRVSSTDGERGRMSREAWGRSMDTGDLARSEVMSLRTTVLGQQTVITELQVADRRRQAMITELLAVNRRRQA